MPASTPKSRKTKSPPRPSRSAKKHTTTPAKPVAPKAKSGSAITSYSSALRWLYEHTDLERMRMVRYNSTTFNLDRMRKLLKVLGNPEKEVAAIHIAGTKGKGSTVAMLDAMLRACGYTVGTYTSPHLVDLRERIAINGQMIGQGALTDLFKLTQKKAARLTHTPSFFEIMTACALRHFADEAVDLAVLETGMGGRLDCTNVVKPLACGITQISLDHTNVLGKDLPSIAREKGGIMKKGVPCVSVEQCPTVVRELKAVAEEIGTPIEFTGKEIEFSYRFEANRELGPHTRVCLTTPHAVYEHLPVPLKGEHQALNCGLALALLHKLHERGYEAPVEKVITGLASTQLAGRMELAWEEPRILLDGAHNAASIKALIKSIGAHIPYDSLVLIFGCAIDKDILGMLKQINLGADKIIFTRAKANPRACDPADLLFKFNEISGKMAQTAPDLDRALNLAARAVSREDIICITGSFYLVGEAKKYLADLAAKRAKAGQLA